ncbi:hypothetical protein [Microbulbifer rhizosphaerae]|uniref:RiboL-PSP-HEPN domain-containing protein n=1 Tax=Microbulbifer rhizosphaerae TaxID=1562603 RepID=A0A7W4ZCU6_9GAMM|nr:hypothetical protein [Microbulbifer rhizosphaerae]MBB3063685.1 hypothetical protein [Microbulbifer rhizosphaerae]
MQHQGYIHEMEEKFESLHESVAVSTTDSVSIYANLKYSEIFPKIHRDSIFISTVGYLEYLLVGFCRVCERDFSVKQSIKKRSNLRDTFIYLTDIVGLDLTPLSEEVSYFNDCSFIRNSIAHRAGIISENLDQEAFNRLQKKQEIALDTNFCVVISRNFILEFVANCRAIFIQLEEPVDRKIIERFGPYNHLTPDEQLALIDNA